MARNAVREPRYVAPPRVIGVQPDLFGGQVRELIADRPPIPKGWASDLQRYTRALVEMDRNDVRPFHLVACVKSKLGEPARAADLYVSDWFRKARAYVETVGGPWLILSAEHGVIDPGQIVAPYERSLATMTAEDRRQWGARVVSQLAARPDVQGRPLVILAGSHYRAPVEAWAGARASVPMRGLGLGEQKAWLAAEAAFAACKG